MQNRILRWIYSFLWISIHLNIRLCMISCVAVLAKWCKLHTNFLVEFHVYTTSVYISFSCDTDAKPSQIIKPSSDDEDTATSRSLWLDWSSPLSDDFLASWFRSDVSRKYPASSWTLPANFKSEMARNWPDIYSIENDRNYTETGSNLNAFSRRNDRPGYDRWDVHTYMCISWPERSFLAKLVSFIFQETSVSIPIMIIRVADNNTIIKY